jgi:hypothetical protein
MIAPPEDKFPAYGTLNHSIPIMPLKNLQLQVVTRKWSFWQTQMQFLPLSLSRYTFPAATTSFTMHFFLYKQPIFPVPFLCGTRSRTRTVLICFSEPNSEEVLHKSKELPSIREDYLWANTQKLKKLTLNFSMLATTSRK